MPRVPKLMAEYRDFSELPLMGGSCILPIKISTAGVICRGLWCCLTAMARKDASMRWTVVTIDNADGGKNALDRITILKDVLDRIALAAILDCLLGRAVTCQSRPLHRSKL